MVTARTNKKQTTNCEVLLYIEKTHRELSGQDKNSAWLFTGYIYICFIYVQVYTKGGRMVGRNI